MKNFPWTRTSKKKSL